MKKRNDDTKTSSQGETTYSDFIKGLNLTSVRLRSASVKFSPDIYTALPRIRFSYHPEVCAKRLDGFEAALECTVHGRKTARSPLLATIKCSFVAYYETEVAATDELYEMFERTSLIHNLWPYVREFVQNCTERAGLPPLTLPSLLFIPHPRD